MRVLLSIAEKLSFKQIIAPVPTGTADFCKTVNEEIIELFGLEVFLISIG